MARCRIFLFTYKRNDLLPRAVRHLVNQTFQDWICEVHNDSPGNAFPAEFIKSLNDPRFTVNNHEVNLGGTASFNLAFNGCTEDYVSILEDDNWWEPDFLQEMITLMDGDPKIKIAWSNMNVWREGANSQWENTGKTIWPITENPQKFIWPDYIQALGALHSNGAMLFRGNNAGNYIIPDSCEFSVIEGVRERTFEFPIYLLPKPLANFSLTLQTSRTTDPMIWTGSQVMLLGSFIQGADNPHDMFRRTLAWYRPKHPTPVATFFLVLIFVIKDPALLKHFKLTDWLAFGKWTLKHLFSLGRLRKYLRNNEGIYDFLLTNTIKQHHNSLNQP